MAYRYLAREREALRRAASSPGVRALLDSIAAAAGPGLSLILADSRAFPAEFTERLARAARDNMRDTDYERKTLREHLRNVRSGHGDLLVLARGQAGAGEGARGAPGPGDPGEPLAFCAFRLIEEAGAKRLYVWEIHCVEGQTGRGYGSALLEALLCLCRRGAPGIREIALTCSRRNPGALRFYARHGFGPAPDSPEGEGYDILCLPVGPEGPEGPAKPAGAPAETPA